MQKPATKMLANRNSNEISGRPINATATPAIRNTGISTRRKLERSINCPIISVPSVPPICKVVPAITAVAVDRPASLAIVGNQFDRKYRFTRFMKLMIHNRIVTLALPSWNNCSIGAPLPAFSLTT